MLVSVGFKPGLELHGGCTLFKRELGHAITLGLRHSRVDPQPDHDGVAGIHSLIFLRRKMRKRMDQSLPTCLVLVRTFQELCITLSLRTKKLPTINMATFSGMNRILHHHQRNLKQHSQFQ